jgi:glutathione S-transferase
MKLYWSPASPYARKVRVVAREKDIAGRIEEVVVDAFADPAELVSANPLGKVPTLLLEDGSTLYDSPVICTYLDAIGEGPPLVPQEAPALLAAALGKAGSATAAGEWLET